MASALLTDRYQLTMLQACFDRGMNATASFEFFVRKLPAQHAFIASLVQQGVGDGDGFEPYRRRQPAHGRRITLG